MTLFQRFAAAAALLFTATMAQADGIEIHDAYAISGANPMTGAAFMVIHNTAAQDDHLIGVRSDMAALVQLHETSMSADGVMSMRHLADGLYLPSGGEIVLERGALHVMFMGLPQPFAQGQEVVIYLQFQVAGEVAVTMIVDNEAMPMAHGDMTQEMDHDEDQTTGN